MVKSFIRWRPGSATWIFARGGVKSIGSAAALSPIGILQNILMGPEHIELRQVELGHQAFDGVRVALEASVCQDVLDAYARNVQGGERPKSTDGIPAGLGRRT